MDIEPLLACNLSDELELWRVRWDIDEERIICRRCGALQEYLQSRSPFPHFEGCVVALPAAEFPWRDLAFILRRSTAVRP